jgi:hypothetical protein
LSRHSLADLPIVSGLHGAHHQWLRLASIIASNSPLDTS